MPRLFVGVPIPKLPGFDAVQEQIGTRDEGVKRVDLDQTHVTLKFIGDVDEADVPRIEEAVSTALRPFEEHAATVEGVGAFASPRKARVVWAAVKGSKMPEMATAIEDHLEPLGIDREGRSFHPHVTLARLKHPRTLTVELEMFRERVFGEAPIAEVVLFESTLTPQGPTYTRRATWTLGGAGDDSA